MKTNNLTICPHFIYGKNGTVLECFAVVDLSTGEILFFGGEPSCKRMLRRAENLEQAQQKIELSARELYGILGD